MRCVRCAQPISNLADPCPHCQFQADPALLEELTHVNWLLEQIHTFELGDDTRQALHQKFSLRQHELIKST